MDQKERDHVLQSIQNRLDNRNGRLSWTLEQGRGQTYRSNKPTLYAHDTYPRRSVMAGRDRRSYVHEFDSVEQAMEVLKGHPILRYLDDMTDGGTTHVDIEIATAGLPEGPDC